MRFTCVSTWKKDVYMMIISHIIFIYFDKTCVDMNKVT